MSLLKLTKKDVLLKGILSLLLAVALVALPFMTPALTSAATGSPVTEYTGGLISGSSPNFIVTGPDGNLWFTDIAGAIGKVNPSTGSVTEYTYGISNPWDIVTGPDGNLWFTDAAGAIGKVNPSTGSVTEYVYSGGSPNFIVTGPHGNLWFTDVAGAIGKVNPSTGTVTKYTYSGSNPWDIVTGPDGNLWFTDSAGGGIGKVDPSTGSVTEYTYSGSHPNVIVTGPDGNLWFTDAAGAIGRVNPYTGSVTEYTSGLISGSIPRDIVTGPDGSLWFTDTAGAIGRVNPYTGSVTEYTSGLISGSYPWDIVTGPDGNLWFTDVAGAIGMINPYTGSVTEYTSGLISGSHPNVIVSGPDGNLWFTDAAGAIGKVTWPFININAGGGGRSSPKFSITTKTLSPATVGRQYSETIVTNNAGTAPYKFSVTGGILPDGLNLSSGSGTISGTPTTAGNYRFTITVKDVYYNTASQTYGITVNTPAPPAMTLKDITGHWAEKNIEKLVAMGAISGYPDGTFRPDNAITRAEFATLLVKAFKLEAGKGKIFADTVGHWARGFISTAGAYGIISGYDQYTFGPDDPVTREQMAVMVVQAAKLTGSEQIVFTDSTDISAWAKGDVATAVGNGIMTGYPDNTFRPKVSATRAEAVTVTVNALYK